MRCGHDLDVVQIQLLFLARLAAGVAAFGFRPPFRGRPGRCALGHIKVLPEL
jgi:hypothetical protein